MPTAEIITIGTEILLGEIVDTNARHIARCLGEHGIDIFRTSSIGDNAGRIADAIHSALERAEIVITTGGLGPTVDDPTRAAVAEAFGVQLEFREDLWQQVMDRFARFDRIPTDNNRRQAYVPSNAVAIENPVGTAPAFMVEDGDRVVIALPGVPREMEHILAEAVIPYLQRRYRLDAVLRIRILHTAGAGESQIDQEIGDLETLSNPTVGLAAHSGQVDVRITAKARSPEAAEALIAPVEAEIRRRLGARIYGADEETLATVALQAVADRGWTVAVLEAGLGGALLNELPGGSGPFRAGGLLPAPPQPPETLLNRTRELAALHGTHAGVGASLYPGEKSEIYLALVTPQDEKFFRIPYGGPPKLAPLRAANLAFDLMRKLSPKENR